MGTPEDKKRALFAAFSEAAEGEFSPDGYEVLGELGRGGMAVVYRAKQLAPLREVALKVMLPRYAGEPEMRERFQREAQAMAGLDHPCILPVYEVGEVDGLPFFSMKLAEGGALADRLKGGSMKIREAVDLVVRMADAIHFAHQRGVLHRDLKPGNFLCDEDGGIYVSDFGVAKLLLDQDAGLTRTQMFVGTPFYMPPEVASGSARDASVAGDQYSLGAVFYECLTGRGPHLEPDTENVASLLRRIVDDKIIAPRAIRGEVPRDIEVICLKAMEKDAARRYRSVGEFGEDLKRWQNGEVIQARPVGFFERAYLWSKRHPLPAVLAGVIAMLILVGAVLLTTSYRDRGSALSQLYLKQAQSERLVAAPGWKGRAFEMLEKAQGRGDFEEIRKEAIAAFSHWDVEEDQGDLLELKERENPNLSPSGNWLIENEGEILRISDPVKNATLWEKKAGVLRCPPIWSADGKVFTVELEIKKKW